MTTEFKELHDKLEDDNYHTDALIVRALYLSRHDLVIRFAEVAQEQEKAGFLTSELNEKRTEIMQELWKEEDA